MVENRGDLFLKAKFIDISGFERKRPFISSLYDKEIKRNKEK